MARRKKHAEHENHERWLVSYADFITLLFAFFVVMYSVSSVNEGRYRVLSEALVAAFRAPARSLAPVQIGSPAREASHSPVELSPMSINRRVAPKGRDSGDGGGARGPGEDAAGRVGGRAGLARVADEVLTALGPLIEAELVRVRQGAGFVEIELSSEVLYDSASAALRAEAVPVLERLSIVLTRVTNPVRVEGYTDAEPIRNAAYASNWELSAARAGGVVHYLAGNGVGDERLALVGYGEHRAIASNDDAEGRQRNRRVVLVVLAGPEVPGPALSGVPEPAADRVLEIPPQGAAAAPSDPAQDARGPGAADIASDALSRALAQAPVPDPAPLLPAAAPPPPRWPADRGVVLPGYAPIALPLPAPGGT